jgi:hypothetical protein
LALETQAGPPSTPQAHISGFLPLPAWDQFLQCHPDQRFAAFIRRGIQHGFRIGFNSAACSLRAAQRNHGSVSNQASQVDKYIAEEVSAGKLRRIYDPLPPGIHSSQIGLIPKKGRPNKFRLIVDLSCPEGHSVNDGISPDLCSFKYASIYQATAQV